ncbi:MAG: XdhC family protein [Deltaproteobacteria bacterium]|nr:XdhC family protein [Deltaproteobacteria bacterium]
MTWTPELVDQVRELLRTNRPFVSVTVVETAGSAPQIRGAHMLVLDDGSALGTVGGGRFEWEMMRVARECLAEGRTRLVCNDLGKDLGMACGGAMTAFLEPHLPAERVIVYGAGHCARAVAPLLVRAGFRVRVVDPRAGFAVPGAFPPGTDLAEADPATDAAQTVRAEDWVLVMTHEHAHDLFTVRAALPRAPRFLGVMASRRKAQKIRQTLEDEGFQREQVDRLHMPVGIDIGAVGPEEIAVSIAAQLIAQRRSPITEP